MSTGNPILVRVSNLVQSSLKGKGTDYQHIIDLASGYGIQADCKVVSYMKPHPIFQILLNVFFLQRLHSPVVIGAVHGAVAVDDNPGSQTSVHLWESVIFVHIL